MPPSPLLAQAIALVEAGQTAQAIPVLAQVLQQEPNNAEAWLWMAEVLDAPDRKRYCIQRALTIDPNSNLARQMLAELERPPAVDVPAWFDTMTTPPPPAPAPAPARSGDAPNWYDAITATPPAPAPTPTQAVDVPAWFDTVTDAPPAPAGEAPDWYDAIAEAPPAPTPVAAPVPMPVKQSAPVKRPPPPAAPARDQQSIKQRLERAVHLVERGRKDEGLTLLEEITAQDPKNEQAWLWLAATTINPAYKRQCLERVLTINPRNKMAKKLLAQTGGDYEKEAKFIRAESSEGGSYAALGAWLAAFFKPWPSTYADILADPEVSLRRAYMWIFTSGGLSTGLAVMLTALLELFSQKNGPTTNLVALLITMVIAPACGGLVGGLIYAIYLSILAGLTHLAAFLTGGRGTFTETFYAAAAYSAALIPCLTVVYYLPAGVKLIVGPLFSLYALWLNIVSIKAAHQCGWLHAIFVGLAPYLLLAGLACGLAVLLLTAGGPEYQNLLHELELTLTPHP